MNYKKLLFTLLVTLSTNIAPLFCAGVNFSDLRKREHVDKTTQTICWEFLDKSNLAAKAIYTITDDQTATLKSLWVAKHYRKQGIASAICKDIIQEIIAKYPAISEVVWLCMTLDEEADFDQLGDFYRKFGAFVCEMGFGSLDIEHYKKNYLDKHHE